MSAERESKVASKAGSGSPSRGAHRRTVALVRSATAEAQRSKLPQMAAALAYRTIFGLIPMMVVALVALRFVYTDDDIKGALNRAMEYSGISTIALDQPPPEEMGPFPEHDPRSRGQFAAKEPAVAAPGELPPSGTSAEPTTGSERLDEWVQDLVLRVSSVNMRAISAIGILFVIYAALAMLVEIERAFNQIYRVPLGRSWVRRIMQYWTLLTLGAIGLATTFYVMGKFNTWVAQEAILGSGEGERTIGLAFLGYFTTVAISTALLLLAYTTVPNTKVKLLPALAGAFIAALMWEAGKWGFTQYLQYSAFYARLYGSIALIPLFLLWVYFTWMIVLVGLQVSYQLQHVRHATVAQPTEALGPTIVDPSASILIMGALARRFESGKQSTAKELAAELDVGLGLVKQMLAGLAEAGLVLRISTSGRDDLFTLARPADRIDSEDVLRIGEALANPSGKPLAAFGQRLLEARHALVRGRTLAMLAQDSPAAADGEALLEVGEAAGSSGPATPLPAATPRANSAVSAAAGVEKAPGDQPRDGSGDPSKPLRVDLA
jgi:membrane protein